MRLLIWIMDMVGRALIGARKWLVLRLPRPVAVRLIPAMAGAASQDIYNRVSVARSIAAQAVTATLNGTGVDLQGYEAAQVILDLGAFGGTTPTATLEIQDSDDNTTFAVVAAANLQGGALPAITAAAANVVIERGYIGEKRYLRGAVTAIGGTTPSLPLSVTILRAYPRKPPV